MKIYCNDKLIVRNLTTNITTITSGKDMLYSKKYKSWYFKLKELGHFKIKPKDSFSMINIKSKGYWIVLDELECINE